MSSVCMVCLDTDDHIISFFLCFFLIFLIGYNRVAVVEYLLQHNADVHAKDKGGLVPLHNSCSYGHFEVTELLVSHGANVNVTDLWKFTPVRYLTEISYKNKANSVVEFALCTNKIVTVTTRLWRKTFSEYLLQACR